MAGGWSSENSNSKEVIDRELKGLIISIAVIILSGMAALADSRQDSLQLSRKHEAAGAKKHEAGIAMQSGQPGLRASLITCAPGPDIYELCGHSALRIRGEGIDSVWNYGVFDFEEPNFVYRFVKGETDYKLAATSFLRFIYPYVEQGRRVTEQELNLSPEETRRLLAMLREEAKPENCRYRYNYVKDNCATRIVDRVGEAAGRRVVYPDTVKYGTFRNEMRAYHAGYPWYQFGIDLALGSGIDLPLRGTDEMFVPVELMEKAGNAHFADGDPLVRATGVINEGKEDAAEPATPFYLAPLFWSWILFIFCSALCLGMLKQRSLYRWLYTLWYGICGLGGCVIFFLVFFSSHEATSPNILLFWLNPLQLIAVASVWSWRLRRLTQVVMWYNVVVISLMLVIWPFQQQSANSAFFPLMLTTLELAGVCLWVISHKSHRPAPGLKYRSNGKRRSNRKLK